MTIITLSMISFDRYYVIRFPMKWNLSNVRTRICIVTTWIYGAIFSAIPSLDIGFGRFTYEGYLVSCSFDYVSNDRKTKNFIFTFFFFAWVIPFCLISFSYANIILIVMTRSSNTSRRESFRHIKEQEMKKQEIKLASVVFFTIFLWFLSWTPYAMIALLGVFNRQDLITPSVSMVPALFCKTAACVNSYVYALSHPKFQKELKRICWNAGAQNRTYRSKIWSTDFQRNRVTLNPGESIDIDEENGIEVGSVRIQNDKTKPVEKKRMDEQIDVMPRRRLSRQSTIIEMICFKPSFKNEASNMRKLVRKWSSKKIGDRENDDDLPEQE